VQDVKAQIFHGKPGGRIAYVTLFPMLEEARINLFCYHDLDDPWIAAMRQDPLAALSEAIPAARPFLADLDIVRKLEVRSTDLYAVEGHVQPGLVLIGDAFHSPCPSSGTGMTRILNDIERLTQVHLPAWLQTPGVGRDKIAAFYRDPAKRRVDGISLRRSLHGRASAVDNSLYWRIRRHVGALKRATTVKAQGAAVPGERAVDIMAS
jgi:2-polyprenyl-6-methoxyphenol hydroxylase-like FAD-dependent oxidoreductase